MGSVDVELSGEQLQQLDKASKIELGFPHDFYETVKNYVYAGFADQIKRG